MASWLGRELRLQRNFGPRFSTGSATCLARPMRSLDINVFSGKLPWTLHDDHADHEQLKPAAQSRRIDYPEAGQQDQFRPADLRVPLEYQPRGRPALPSDAARSGCADRHTICALYDEPAQRYCPAGVYEIVRRRRRGASACRSTRRTACTARPATSRIRPRTSAGSCPRAAAAPTIRTCRNRRSPGARRAGAAPAQPSHSSAKKIPSLRTPAFPLSPSIPASSAMR